MAELPTGTVTFLFTDIEGSTRLLQNLGARYGEVLTDHHRLLRAACEEAGGEVIDTQGDAFFVVFTRAKDAVAGAAMAQRALAGHPWPEGGVVRVRMGLDTGEPAMTEAGIVGLALHRAARISAAGHGGQVLLSNTTQDLVRDGLPEGVELRDLGEHRLKDLDRAERIYELVVEGLTDTFPPLKTLAGQPVETPFAGREAELAEAARAVTRRHRNWLDKRVVIAASSLVAGAIVAVALGVTALSDGGETLSAVAPNSVGIVDPDRDAIVGQVPVGVDPVALTVGETGIWVVNRGSQTLSRIDPASRTVVESVGLRQPYEIAVGHGTLWVSNEVDFDLKWFPEREASRGVAYSIDISPGDYALGTAISLAIGPTALWVGSRLPPNVARVDPEEKDVVARTTLTGVAGVAATADGVWVADPLANRVARIDPITGEVTYVRVGRTPDRLAVAARAVWVLNSGDDTVSRVDVRRFSGTVGATIPVGGDVVDIVLGGGSVWVADARGRQIVRIDPRTERIVARIPLRNRPERIVFARGLLWVTVRS